ncbi:hypothetical protein CFC21_047653 [Triticum aestivum]|uniref:Late embryogenesis abundant protein LEA-2 subgroup domain-containing protein n=2 Tax=Triticum aestivum TaxID=4565 RepID=A0A3B6GU48_WHEAT|nr:hypothetical protein CFC21_047653 [Triticum aestivum]
MKVRNLYSLREDLNRAAVVVLWIPLLFWIPLGCMVFRVNGLPPKFSVQVSEARSPEVPRAAVPADPVSTTTTSTAFNITLHAVNRRPADRCYRQGEAVVLYSGLTVAWGRTPRFCVGAMHTRDVTVVAWADDGVQLPTLLRDQMAMERRAGSVELDVDLRLFRSDDGSARPTWMRCKVTTGGPKQMDGVPCTVFALQNWASDVAPCWMQ